MKKILGMFLVGILLMGCQDPQVKEETEVEPRVDTQSVYDSNSQPRSIQLNLGAALPGIEAQLLIFCWNEDLDACSPELKKSPEEALLGTKKFTLTPDSPIKFNVDVDPSKPIPFPDYIELFLVEDEELIPVTITEDSFTLPSKEGTYTYVYKTIYDSDIKGIAFYAFHLNVSN